MNQNHFEIGIITKPQGIKGELRVLPTTDDPWRFELLIGEEVLLRREKTAATPQSIKLTAARVQKGMVYIKLDGVNDRNTAETYTGAAIIIPPDLALPLDDDEYYVRDLIGIEAESESGEPLGHISRIIHTSANDIYEIKPSEGKAFLVPAVKEFVQSVDLAQRKIILRLIEGLR